MWIDWTRASKHYSANCYSLQDSHIIRLVNPSTDQVNIHMMKVNIHIIEIKENWEDYLVVKKESVTCEKRERFLYPYATTLPGTGSRQKGLTNTFVYLHSGVF